MTLDGIKEAIEELPDTERTSLAAWLNEQDSRAWDRQIETDFSEGGAGMSLLAAWEAEIDSEESRPLDDFLKNSNI